MARKRHIEDNFILDAAERVVARLGAAGLSIDAVAKEAGISKSRVVYDHKSKRALLEALVNRQLEQDMRSVREAVEANRTSPHPELFGRIASAEKMPGQIERAVMMAISAAMPSEEALQNGMREWTGADLAAVVGGTDRKRAALMAYLALSGFCFIELFDLYHWDQAERLRILDDIRTIFTSFAEPA